MDNHTKSQPPYPSPPTSPTTLILVCCHAVFIGPTPSSSSHADSTVNPHDPTQWLLQPFQKTESPTFIKHIQTGLDLLHRDPTSVLVFSGGRTKRGQGVDVSEAGGYARVARWLLEDSEGSAPEESEPEKMTQRVVLEEWATDSFQNVLFGLLGWGVWTGRVGDQENFPVLPRKLFVISHEFKRARFMELHLPAIRVLLHARARQEFDETEVEYVGIDPPFSEEERKEVEAGERERGYEPWVGDRFGVGEALNSKRIGRGWDGDGREYLGWWRERLGSEDEVLKEVERMVNGRIEGNRVAKAF